jgi:hypothetical protein
MFLNEQSPDEKQSETKTPETTETNSGSDSTTQQTDSSDLSEMLKRSQERRDAEAKQNTPPVQNTTQQQQPKPTPTPERNYGDFWGDSLIERKPTPAPSSITEGAPNIAPSQKVTKAAMQTGARTAVATIDLAQTTLMRPLLNWRFKKEAQKRYGTEAYEHGMDMIMSEMTPRDDAERSLKARISRFLDQRDRKVRAIPFTDMERKDLELAFGQYFEITNKTMSPEVLLYASIIGSLGKRAIDVLLWD